MQLVLAVATQGLRPVIPDNCPTDYQRLITDCLNEVRASDLQVASRIELH